MKTPLRLRLGSLSPRSLLILIALALGAIGVSVGVGYGYYQVQKDRLREYVLHDLGAVADTRVQQLAQWRRDSFTYAAARYNNPVITRRIKSFLAAPADADRRQEIEAWLVSLQQRGFLQDVYLMDASGTERLALKPKGDVMGPAAKKLLEQSLRTRSMAVKDLHRSAPQPLPHIDLAIPLILPETPDDLIGLLFVRTAPPAELTSSSESWCKLSRTAEICLVRAEGAQVLFLNNLRLREDAALNFSVPIRDSAFASKMALRDFEGHFDGPDYRAVPVFAAIRRVPDSSWAVAVKMDQEEVFMTLQDHFRVLAIGMSVLILGVVLVSGVWLSRQRAKLLGILSEADADRRGLVTHFDYLIKHANDVILLTDQKLRIVEANDKALETYGYSHDQMLRLAMEVLTPPESLATLKEQMEVIEHRSGSTYETTHRRSDGVTFPVEISIRKIEIDGKRFYQAIGRDITERKRSEAALKASEASLKNAQHLARIGSWERDIATKAIIWSDEVYRIYEIELHNTALARDAFMGSVHPEEQDAVIQQYLDSVKNRTFFESDHRLVMQDGRIKHVHTQCETYYDSQGKPLRSVGTTQDITEQKQAAAALEESEEKFKALFEGSHDAILLIDEGKVFDCNRQALELFGYSSTTELAGATLVALSPHLQPDGQESAIAAEPLIRNAFQRGFDRFEWKYRRKNGEEFSVDVMLSAFSVGKRQLLEASLRDISALKKVEAEIRTLNAELEGRVKRRTAELEHSNETLLARSKDLEDARRVALSMMEDADTQRQKLEESTQRLRLLSRAIEESPASVIIMDPQGVIEYINPHFTETTGYTADEALGNRALGPWKRLLKSGINQSESFQVMWNMLSAGQMWQGEICSRKKNGEIFWESTAISPVRSAAGDVTHFVAICEDITERKNLEADLLKAKEAAEAASQAKSAFLANMSHEIRTPMNAILGFSQLLLRDSSATPQQMQHLGTINRSGEHLLALINDILEMSKIEAGRATLNLSAFDLHGLLEDQERMFRLRTDAKRLRFSVQRIGDVPQYVTADEGKLRQILINLLGNAVKFTDQGGIILRIQVEGGTSSSQRLIIEVEDTGWGITPEEQERIFGHFEQTQMGSQAAGGTGLGLAITREYARLMGGEISVCSQMGQGSIFRLNIPLEKAQEPAPTPHAATLANVQQLSPGQPPCRILAVDDREENRMLLSLMLRPVGFELSEAADGAEALEQFTATRPHLILMDLRMPNMDGYEAIRRIRSMEEGRAVKIVALSASVFDDNRQKAIAMGADDFLGKPFHAATLFELIQNQLGVQYDCQSPASSDHPIQGESEGTPLIEGMDALPEGWLAKVRQAVLIADFDRVFELINQISGDYPTQASALSFMAEQFDSKRLLEVTQSLGKRDAQPA